MFIRLASQTGELVAIEFIDGMTLREHIHHRHSELSKLLRYAFATVYTGLGEKDKAFEAWRSACRKIGAVLAVKVDPIFDDLRSDPRFPDLVRCIGLTP